VTKERVEEALSHIYQEADSMYVLPERDVHPRAYTELCLVVAECLDGREDNQIPASEVKQELSGETRSELKGKGGVTEVRTSDSTLTVHSERESYFVDGERRWKRLPTFYEVGTTTAEAYSACKSELSDGPAEWATAAEALVEDGELDRLNSLFFAHSSSSTSPADTGTGTNQGRDQTRTTQDTGTEAETTAIVPNIVGGPEIGEEMLESVSVAANGRFEDVDGVVQERTGRGNQRTGRGNWPAYRRGEPKNRVRLQCLSEQEVEELLSRTPSGSAPRNVVPTELREDIIEWRPILGESEPLMALHQLNLMSFRRDDDYTYDGDCTNVPIYHERIFDSFGLVPQVAYNAGLNTGMLLELYRWKVDPELDWTHWHPKKGKSRVIKSHGIPQTIIQKAKELMLTPSDYDDWSILISGKSANRRNWTKTLREERLGLIEDNEPLIDPPESTRRIQSYLNGLKQTTFSHGGHGILRGERLDDAIWEVTSSIDSEQRRDEELRKLYWMRKFPQPLYLPCDRFPRLKADYYNQAMNLPSNVLRATYDERDYELDLSKAHLASYVPVARRYGLDVPVLEDYLDANLSGDMDLWTELASVFDTDVMDNAKARRKAVKRAYSAVYGSARQNLLYRILQKYGKVTGHFLDSFDPIEPLLSHPLMEELLATRDKLEVIINDREGLKDADGRFIPLSAWNETKDKENRWRGCMAYVNSSYEQKLMAAALDEAQAELERGSSPRFRIWLYQADGVTVRMGSKASHSNQIDRLQNAVADKADELGVPTELEVDFTRD
jgi:hypothetical protein